MEKGMNGNDVRRKNRGLFLKSIALGIANSRTEIARLTGLTKMTAGNIAQELIQLGVIEEGESQQNANAGPNPQRLLLSAAAPKIIGVYLSRDTLSVSLGNLSGELLQTEQVALVEENAGTLQKKVLQLTRRMIQAADRVLAIGVSVIGPIDKNGAVSDSPNFFNIRYFPIKSMLVEAFELPVYICNDTSASAIAEQLIGNAHYSSFAYIGLGNGISAGIINNGHLLKADNAFIGELGHTTIDFNGDVCPCGNRGCLELYVSLPVLIDRLSNIVHHPVKPQDFAELILHPDCETVFRQATACLTAALVNLTNIVRPQAIIIGHDGFYWPDASLAQIEAQMNRQRFTHSEENIPVQKSALRDQAALYGSICCVLKEVFDGSLLI